MKVVVYTRLGGRVSVVVPSEGERQPRESDDDLAARVRDLVVPPGSTNIEILDINTLPGDRIFRDAWRKSGSIISVDMPEARKIHLDRLRRARDQELNLKDKDFTRAHGKKNQPEQDRVETERENLRNLPQTVGVTAATTPTELLATWPTELAAYDPKTGRGTR